MRRKHREALDLFAANGYDRLATFNSERARGIVHTPEMVAEMAAIKTCFDAEHRARYEAEGVVFYEPRP